jgi:hypothetical protein
METYVPPNVRRSQQESSMTRNSQILHTRVHVYKFHIQVLPTTRRERRVSLLRFSNTIRSVPLRPAAGATS